MAITVTTTVGADNANAYASVAEGDAHFEADSSDGATAWLASSDDEKGKALILATQRIDQEEYRGSPVNPLVGTSEDTVQALKFPRNGAVSDEGWAFLSTVIPEPLKKATIELAGEILAGGVSLTDTGLEGFDVVKLGPLSVTPRQTRVAGALPAHVRRFLRPLLVTPSRLNFDLRRA